MFKFFNDLSEYRQGNQWDKKKATQYALPISFPLPSLDPESLNSQGDPLINPAGAWILTNRLAPLLRASHR